VKSFDTESAAEVIKPVVGPATGVLPIQNGVDHEAKLEQIVGRGHAMGGVAQVFATIAEPGVIRHALLGRIIFGEMDGRRSERARAFHAACERAAIPVELSPDVLLALWEKYVFLAAHAGMTARSRLPAGPLRQVPETREMYRRLLEEMAAPRPGAGGHS